MKVTDTSVVGVLAGSGHIQGRPANKPAVESANRARPEPAVVYKPDAVSVSPQGDDIAGQAGDAGMRPNVADSGHPKPSRNTNIDVRRDYSVDDGGDVVVKVIDQQKDEVVREIPSKEQRQIKQAIEEINRQSVATANAHESARQADIPGAANRPDSANGGVDVTT